MKVIQISGIKGILSVVFIGSCLIAGFVGFPGLVAMCLWNWAASSYYIVPEINIFQGILLWAIAALIYFIADRKKVIVSFSRPDQLNDEEMKWLMHKIKKSEMRKPMVINTPQIKKEASEIKEVSEITEKEEEKITK